MGSCMRMNENTLHSWSIQRNTFRPKKTRKLPKYGEPLLLFCKSDLREIYYSTTSIQSYVHDCKKSLTGVMNYRHNAIISTIFINCFIKIYNEVIRTFHFLIKHREQKTKSSKIQTLRCMLH